MSNSNTDILSSLMDLTSDEAPVKFESNAAGVENKNSVEKGTLLKAIVANDFELAKKLIIEDPKRALEQDNLGRNALMIAFTTKNDDFVEFILNHLTLHNVIKELVVVRDKNNQTALAYAVRTERVQYVSRLLNIPNLQIRDQLITVTNFVGETLFMEACRAFKPNFKKMDQRTKNSIAMLETLALDSQGRIAIPATVLTTPNRAGEIVLFQAVHHAVLPLVKLLLQWHPTEQLSLINNYFKELSQKTNNKGYNSLQTYAQHWSAYKPIYQPISDFLLTFEKGYIKSQVEFSPEIEGMVKKSPLPILQFDDKENFVVTKLCHLKSDKLNHNGSSNSNNDIMSDSTFTENDPIATMNDKEHHVSQQLCSLRMGMDGFNKENADSNNGGVHNTATSEKMLSDLLMSLKQSPTLKPQVSETKPEEPTVIFSISGLASTTNRSPLKRRLEDFVSAISEKFDAISELSEENKNSGRNARGESPTKKLRLL